MLLAGIVLSAAGIFMLAVHLTGSRAAGVTAGIIFAFVPYRFDHYMHMELQWTVWVPWAFWSLHRAFETGSRRYAGMMGAFVALQFMSSIYYGVFLATLLALCALLLLCGMREHGSKRGMSLTRVRRGDGCDPDGSLRDSLRGDEAQFGGPFRARGAQV